MSVTSRATTHRKQGLRENGADDDEEEEDDCDDDGVDDRVLPQEVFVGVRRC